MANEAVQRDKVGEALNFTVEDNQAMEKGTIVFLSGARTVYPTAADNNAVIGVIAREKIAGDGRESVPVFVNGIFDCKVEGAAITVGDDLTVSGANILKIFTAGDAEDGSVLGKALEAATGTATIQVMVNRG